MNTRYWVVAAILLALGAGAATAQLDPFGQNPQFHKQHDEDRLGRPQREIGPVQVIAEKQDDVIVLFMINTATGKILRLRNAGNENVGHRNWQVIRRSPLE